MRHFGVVGLAVLLVSAAVPAVAQSGVSGGRECPRMHMVVVHDAADSAALSDQDHGFLGSIVKPVVDAANPGVKDYSAGFSAAASSVAQPVPSVSGGWKKDVWGTSAPAAASSAATTAPAVSSSVVGSTGVSTTQEQQNDGVAQVSRTYVNVEGFRTGAFIPGVHSETDASWRDHVDGGLKKTSAVVEEIHRTCPDTKLVLLGNSQGAAVVSELARSIGAGEGPVPSSVIAGVATFADPTRAEDWPTTTDRSNAVVKAPAASGQGLATVAEGSASRGYGSLEGKTVSWCVEGDTRCGIKKAAPAVRLAEAANREVDFARNPEASLRYVADVLAPAVALASVETLAEDVQFGGSGFRFSRAASADETLIGRIAVNTESSVDRSDMDRRLVAAGAQLGGMALAAGVTVAKKVITPANIAQIAAASAAGPEAAAVVVGVKVIEAGASLFTAETATSGAVRLLDEAKAGGMEVPEVAEAAVETVVGEAIGDSAYVNQPITDRGQSASGATKTWLAGLAAKELGDDAPEGLVAASRSPEKVSGVRFDKAAVDAAVAGLRKDQG
ncbi:Cutinase (plasmid) [Corynebacterium mustelae]|uniref:Cutinase n=1 Tax=Corynebacterium mustelae TaxID=571915 RepID=A0A0G3H1W4_9CORY|nr:cutinase family protein [Corynebacterium mustelae]AKK07404.1 Cutinase [Corynebacterium mustelae]